MRERGLYIYITQIKMAIRSSVYLVALPCYAQNVYFFAISTDMDSSVISSIHFCRLEVKSEERIGLTTQVN